MVQIEAIPMANEVLVFPQIGDPNCFIRRGRPSDAISVYLSERARNIVNKPQTTS